MTTKSILQTLGTVSSCVLFLITLKVTKSFQSIEAFNLMDMLHQYESLILMVCTVGIMMATGFSYFDSRFEYDGFTRFLYTCVAIVHVALAPISLLIAVLKIEFGEYWLGIAILIIMLIYWGSQQKETQN